MITPCLRHDITFDMNIKAVEINMDYHAAQACEKYCAPASLFQKKALKMKFIQFRSTLEHYKSHSVLNISHKIRQSADMRGELIHWLGCHFAGPHAILLLSRL